MKSKKAQEEGFGGLSFIAKAIITIAILLIVLAFLAKAGEWLGVWEIPWM